MFEEIFEFVLSNVIVVLCGINPIFALYTIVFLCSLGCFIAILIRKKDIIEVTVDESELTLLNSLVTKNQK